jgi:hypothetical protein
MSCRRCQSSKINKQLERLRAENKLLDENSEERRLVSGSRARRARRLINNKFLGDRS